jgi:hypothetical protein
LAAILFLPFEIQTEVFLTSSLDRFINKGHKKYFFMPKQSRLASGYFCPDFKWSGIQIPGTGIRYNPNTARGSVFGGLRYLFAFILRATEMCFLAGPFAVWEYSDHSKTGQSCIKIVIFPDTTFKDLTENRMLVLPYKNRTRRRMVK